MSIYQVYCNVSASGGAQGLPLIVQSSSATLWCLRVDDTGTVYTESVSAGELA